MKSFAPLLASKATYICHNEEQAVLYYQAASHHQHNTKRDLLTQAVNTASFIHVLLFFVNFILYSMQSLDGMRYAHLIKSSHVHNKPHYAFGGKRAGQELALSFCRTASHSVIVCACACVCECVPVCEIRPLIAI